MSGISKLYCAKCSCERTHIKEIKIKKANATLNIKQKGSKILTEYEEEKQRQEYRLAYEPQVEIHYTCERCEEESFLAFSQHKGEVFIDLWLK